VLPPITGVQQLARSGRLEVASSARRAVVICWARAPRQASNFFPAREKRLDVPQLLAQLRRPRGPASIGRAEAAPCHVLQLLPGQQRAAMAVELTITDFLRGVATGRQPGPHPGAIFGGQGQVRASNGLQQMPGVRRHSVKRDADRVRPLKSWRQISLPLIGQLELTVLLPLVFTANVIVATIVWFVVGSLLR
jgi:hypothetical protein